MSAKCIRYFTAVTTLILLLTGADPSPAEEATSAAAVQLSGTEGEPITLTAAELKKLPRTTVDAVDRAGKAVKFSGVAVHHLLEKAKAPLGESLRGERMRLFVCVEAKDKYGAVFALPEFDPAFTDRVIILADEQDGQPLGEGKGPYQIIVPGEKRHSRWVRMVEKIRVLDSKALLEKAPATTQSK